jgi:hypothetical protein
MQVPVKDTDCYAGIPSALVKGKAPTLQSSHPWTWLLIPLLALVLFLGLLLCFMRKPTESEDEKMRRKRLERYAD